MAFPSLLFLRLYKKAPLHLKGKGFKYRRGERVHPFSNGLACSETIAKRGGDMERGKGHPTPPFGLRLVASQTTTMPLSCKWTLFQSQSPPLHSSRPTPQASFSPTKRALPPFLLFFGPWRIDGQRAKGREKEQKRSAFNLPRECPSQELSRASHFAAVAGCERSKEIY